jgi:hypothetical protein
MYARQHSLLLIQVSQNYAEIAQFLGSVQKLRATELQGIEDRIAEGEPIPQLDAQFTCYYRFARRYCLHVSCLSIELRDKVLTPT